jgi:hypothetical protein
MQGNATFHKLGARPRSESRARTTSPRGTVFRRAVQLRKWNRCHLQPKRCTCLLSSKKPTSKPSVPLATAFRRMTCRNDSVCSPVRLGAQWRSNMRQQCACVPPTTRLHFVGQNPCTSQTSATYALFRRLMFHHRHQIARLPECSTLLFTTFLATAAPPTVQEAVLGANQRDIQEMAPGVIRPRQTPSIPRSGTFVDRTPRYQRVDFRVQPVARLSSRRRR